VLLSQGEGTQYAQGPRSLEEVRALNDIFNTEDTVGPIDPELVKLYEQLLIVIPAEGAAGAAAKAAGAARGAAPVVRSVAGAKIVFGQNANQISHAFRHVDSLGLSRGAVQAAIRADLRAGQALVPGKLHIGNVQVGGQSLQ